MRLKYRPEIDGLRAMAVLAVVFYHAEFVFYGMKPFKGGYIGVDIFFVISGYLITSIILSDLNDGKFSFVKFYERRARRLLPALFSVMFVSIPFAWLYMLPKAMKEYAGSVLSSLFFSSNFWFWMEESYWAEPSALKPFLHTWSLSVEEQFYIFFPFSLFLLWKFIPRYIIGVFLFFGLFSLQFADFLTPKAPEFTFFLLPARGWELLAGAFLAKLEMDYGRSRHPVLEKIAPAVGVYLIVYSVIFFDTDTQHPSFLTALPVIGTMLIIWFARSGELFTDILQSKLMVGLGLVSYSLYLWHYPIFAFSRIKNAIPSQFEKFEQIGLSIFLAVLTFYVVERPARYRVKIKTTLATIFIAFFALISFSITALRTEGNLWRYGDWQLRFLGDERSVGAKYVKTNYNTLALGNHFSDNTRPKLLFIGDSYSQDFYNILNENDLLVGLEVSAHYLPTRCKNIPSSLVQPSKHINKEDLVMCKNTVRVGSGQLLDEMIAKSDGVIVASWWDEITIEHVRALREQLHAEGSRNILIVGRKQFPTISNQKLMKLNLMEIVNIRIPVNERKFGLYQSMRNKIQEDVLDLHALICGDSNKCPVSTTEGYLISYDGDHLTKEGAKFIGEKLSKYSVFNRFYETLTH